MKLILAIILVVFFSTRITVAQIPQTISWQGIIKNAQGELLNGDHNLTVKLYDSATEGTCLWTETHEDVTITDGITSIILGSINDLNLTFDSQYWLEIIVGDGTPLSRIMITSVPYALYAKESPNELTGVPLILKDSEGNMRMRFNPDEGNFEMFDDEEELWYSMQVNSPLEERINYSDGTYFIKDANSETLYNEDGYKVSATTHSYNKDEDVSINNHIFYYPNSNTMSAYYSEKDYNSNGVAIKEQSLIQYKQDGSYDLKSEDIWENHERISSAKYEWNNTEENWIQVFGWNKEVETNSLIDQLSTYYTTKTYNSAGQTETEKISETTTYDMHNTKTRKSKNTTYEYLDGDKEFESVESYINEIYGDYNKSIYELITKQYQDGDLKYKNLFNNQSNPIDDDWSNGVKYSQEESQYLFDQDDNAINSRRVFNTFNINPDGTVDVIETESSGSGDNYTITTSNKDNDGNASTSFFKRIPDSESLSLREREVTEDTDNTKTVTTTYGDANGTLLFNEVKTINREDKSVSNVVETYSGNKSTEIIQTPEDIFFNSPRTEFDGPTFWNSDASFSANVEIDGNQNVGGNQNIEGNHTVQGTKSFRIDHPTDNNKYLLHASMESNEVLNVYSGNVTTDDDGFATVTLPDYFDDINTDYRYVLTVVGTTFARAIVYSEIEDNEFQIRTDEPNIKVSWQVIAKRNDEYLQDNPFNDVLDK
jgi:hypothetical protein